MIASLLVLLIAVPEAPVDVAVQGAPIAHRTLSIEWNPLPLVTIGRLSLNAVLTPSDHDAIVLAPFYAWASTEPISVFDDHGGATLLPEQKFKGGGGELGYRYYFGLGGPRGFFLGPSLILGAFTATAQDRSETKYIQFGVAADAGYETVILDAVSLSIGGGVQATGTSEHIPAQQFPAKFYANNGV
jgi:hypothetical protein